MLGITQAKRVDALLPMIVSGLVDRADFALARIWLVETPNSHADNRERFLRLSASAGSSQVDRRIWNGIEGEFSKIRFGALKIGYIAQRGAPLHLDEHEIKHSHWTASPDWVARRNKRLCRTPPYLPRRSPGSTRSVQPKTGLTGAISMASFVR
jgi:hypothetical protein